MASIRTQTFPKERLTIIDFAGPLENSIRQAWYECQKLGISQKRRKDVDKITNHFFLTNLLRAYNEIKNPFPKVFGVYSTAVHEDRQKRLVRLAKLSGYPVCEFKKWGSPDMASAGLKVLQKFDFNYGKIKKVIHRMGLKQFENAMKKKQSFCAGDVEQDSAPSVKI